MTTFHQPPYQADGLYDPRYEHDACGVALVARLDNQATREVVDKALMALENLEHRGATGADSKSGDGAGILTQMPDAFLREEVDFELPPAGTYGVAMCFLPTNAAVRTKIEALLELNTRVEGQEVLGWRDIPIDEELVGSTANRTRPVMRQLFVAAPRRVRDRSGRVRAQALRHPAHLRAGLRPGVLRLLVLLAHDRLQGDVHPRPGPRLLPGPAGRALHERDVPRALALLDEHVPELGARAPVPVHRPQRRDQHADGQRQLDARTGVRARVRAVRQGPRQGHADRAARRVGLGDLRQRPRAAHAGRALPAARGDDDDPGGLRRPGRPARGPRQLLRVPRVSHGAVGRPRRGGLHRRARRRRDARPQRPAPRPLARDARRPRHPRLRGRPAEHHAARGQAPRPPAAGQALPRRPREGAHRRRRRGQARGRVAAALRRVGLAQHGPLRRPRAGARDDDRRRADPAAPARLRLHAGGPPRPHRADGRQRRGAARLDGQRRRARGPLRPPAAALQLLQAALRAGHEPADRPDPRVDRHVAGHRRRLGAEPPGRDARARPPAGHEPADPAQLGARDAAPRLPRRLQRAHDRHHLAARRRRRGPREAPRADLRRGPSGDRGGDQHPRPLRPPDERRARPDPRAARGRGDASPPRARGHAPARGTRPGVR